MRGEMQLPSEPRRGWMRGLAVTASLTLLIALPLTAAAGRGGKTTTPWIELATTDGQSLVVAVPQLGTVVAFATGYARSTKNPWISLSCFQDGAIVYGEGGTPDHEFTLGGASSDWVRAGGAATCRAELGDLYWQGGHQYYEYLAQTEFATEG